MFLFQACMGWTISFEKLLRLLSLVTSLLALLSFRSFLITSFYVYLDCPQEKVTLTLKVLHFLDQTFFSIFSRWLNYHKLLSCKHFHALFSLRLLLSFSAEVLSWDRTFYIHITILASFIPILKKFSSLNDQALVSYSIMLRIHAEYKLSFAPNGKIA